jgi:hypothetical protein
MFGGEAFQSLKLFKKALGSSVYMNIVTATGIEAAEPQTHLGMLFVLAFSWLCMMLLAAYTGKLAVFMSFQKVVLAPGSVSDFVKNPDYKACVLKDSAYASYLAKSERYGSIAQVIEGFFLLLKLLSLSGAQV